MLRPEALLSAVRACGIDFFAGVPDSLLKDFLAVVAERTAAGRHITCPNEGSAVALACGYHLATGGVPLVYMQNSGLGNAVSPLMSLSHPAVYGIPLLLLIGWRGQPGVDDEPQHQAMGASTGAMLDCLGVPYRAIGADCDDIAAVLRDLVDLARQKSMPVALLVGKGTFAAATETSPQSGELPVLTRKEAIRAIVGSLDQHCVFVATTGLASRELYEIRAETGAGHGRDFLNVGAMGHVSQIALGISLGQPDRLVVCLDGDGSLIMHMGSLVTIGVNKPKNLIHVLIDNGVHDSVGGQPTGFARIDALALARSCGYEAACRCASAAELAETFGALPLPGPTFIEVVVAPGAAALAGRPDADTGKRKDEFMRFLRSRP